ncbi:MAG: RnfABCDGE type electron transport complex subunit B [Verrucomicrobiota bacterium]|nr:RnfABCDGE type electron transport complex subunit B [Verrucomicrobiota bacterium]
MSISVEGIFIPFLVLGLMGAAFAALLFVSYRFLAVKGDPRLELFMSILPGSNCGACGHAGCLAYAETLGKEGVEPTGCLVGGAAVAAKLARAMGVSVETREDLVAFVACRAGRKIAKKKYAYVGVDNCQAANLLFGGDKYCAYGCLGLGSCVRVCPFDAIRITEERLAAVDSAKCRSCRKCVKACPRKLIGMAPRNQAVLVACGNLDNGKRAKEVCSIACIACRICEKNCPTRAVAVVNNLAVIDYAKCARCAVCVEKCPQKSILFLPASV